MSHVITTRYVRKTSSSPTLSSGLPDDNDTMSSLNKHSRATISTSGYLNDNNIIPNVVNDDERNDIKRSENIGTYVSPFKSEENNSNTEAITIVIDNIISPSIGGDGDNNSKKHMVYRKRRKKKAHTRYPSIMSPTTILPRVNNNTENETDYKEKKVIKDHSHVLKSTNYPISSIKPINIKKAMEIQQYELKHMSSSSSLNDNSDEDGDDNIENMGNSGTINNSNSDDNDSCSYPTINVRKRKNKGKKAEEEEEEDVSNNVTDKTAASYVKKYQSISLPTTPTDTRTQFLSSSSSPLQQSSVSSPTKKSSSTSILGGLTRRITTTIKSSPRNCSNIVKKISKNTLRRSKSDKHTPYNKTTTTTTTTTQYMDKREYFRRYYQEPHDNATVISDMIGHHVNTIEENSYNTSSLSSSSVIINSSSTTATCK